jgi:restriction system protein
MRQVAAQQRAARQAQVEADRAERAYERAKALDAKERQRLLVEAQVARVEADNDDLEALISELEGLLTSSLSHRPVKFATLKRHASVSAFNPGSLAVATPAPDVMKERNAALA